MIRPDGWVAAITENRHGINLQKLTKKRATFAWEWMFSKSWYGYDLDSQGAILDRCPSIKVGCVAEPKHKRHSPQSTSVRSSHYLG